MCFVCWDTNVFSDKNIAPMFPTGILMSYSSKDTINNETEWINIILKHTSTRTEYFYSVTNSMAFFWIHKHHAVTTTLTITAYPVMYLLVLLSTIYYASLYTHSFHGTLSFPSHST